MVSNISTCLIDLVIIIYNELTLFERTKKAEPNALKWSSQVGHLVAGH